MESKFQEFLSKYKEKRIAIVTHNKADADAICSAYALSKILPNSIICTHEEMRTGARMLADKFGIEVMELDSLDKKEYEGIVVLDTAAYTLAPEARDWKILCIIDHHQAHGKDMMGEFELIDSSSPSSAEIVAGLLPEIDRDSAFALAVGIIADGARFKSARKETFAVLSRLMGIADVPYIELLDYAEPEPPMEAKLAILNSMKKVEFVYSAGYVIATSEAGCNESDVASVMTEAADVAFIAKWKDRDKESRISARARKNVKVPLNEVMAEAGKALGGAGGGHPKAAGAALKAHTQEALKKCVEIFISRAEGHLK